MNRTNQNRTSKNHHPLLLASLVLIPILTGCLSSTTVSGEDGNTPKPVLFGLYEGIDSNIFTGKVNYTSRRYYRINTDGTFRYYAIQDMPGMYPASKSFDSVFTYVMFYTRKGILKTTDSTIQYSNLYSRWSGLENYYTLSLWKPDSSYATNIHEVFSTFNHNGFALKNMAPDSFVLAYRRIGEASANIPIRYLGDEFE